MVKNGSIDYNMNLAWHIRLVDRMIKRNPNATIKDYYSIVDKEEENVSAQGVELLERVYGAIEWKDPPKVESKYKFQQRMKAEERHKELKLRVKKRKYLRYKKSLIA